MGTWNTGNFDCDGACEYLNDAFQQPLIERIESIIVDPVAIQLDEQGEDILMPSVELLALLCETYGGTFPDVATVRSWRDLYLSNYDGYIDLLSPGTEYKAARRQVIELTFTRLENAIKQHQKS